MEVWKNGGDGREKSVNWNIFVFKYLVWIFH
jgi:hypothetical protein